GLQGIKVKNKKKIPSNITTIKHFKIDDETNFMSYGSSTKNLYLILLEDL
ncbi:MAG: lactate utilization protein B/C, partial [Flavobacteriaceae bacterium]